MKKTKKNNVRNILENIIAFTMIGIGAAMAAAALEIFLIPNSIIDGGLTGISIILNKLFGGSLSIFILVLNIPFFILGYKQMGKRFIIKAGFAILVFTYLLSSFHSVDVVTDDIILATIYGGLLLGVGVGLVIKFGGCLDGTEITAILISKNSSISVGQAVLFFNIFIYGCAVFVFGPDRALYSLLTYFITFKIIDMVSEGMDQVKAVTIITNNSEDISKEIFRRLGRNVTILNGSGLMSHPDKIYLYVVITRLELPELREIIKEADADSFVTVSDVSEVIGPHIKRIPTKRELKRLKNRH